MSYLSAEFWFIKDAKLGQQLLNDWREAQAVFNANAWKSCVILCGGILEGILLDALSTEKHNDGQHDRRSLANLVDEAAKCKIIHQGTAHLSHALREYRNLIHPARHLSLGIDITYDEANIAVCVVRAILKELSGV